MDDSVVRRHLLRLVPVLSLVYGSDDEQEPAEPDAFCDVEPEIRVAIADCPLGHGACQKYDADTYCGYFVGLAFVDRPAVMCSANRGGVAGLPPLTNSEQGEG